MAGERAGSWHSASWAGFVLALVLGAITWALWLGWDNEYYYDAAVDAYQGPYRPWQVAGCALTFALVTALLAMRWNPFLVAGGTTLGFWLPWTVRAATEDETGLFAVGSALLLIGLAVGSVVAALIGARLRRR
ncbi:MAG: hypothetical protein Q4G67_02315 [Actinomycetia bacterium]|nr:hypothetical protein [Actinomycetes bacterium]